MRAKSRVTRRRFLKQGGAGAAGLGMLSVGSPAALGSASPTDMIGVGHIGIGVRGGSLRE